MVTNKHISKVVAALMAAAIAFCLLAAGVVRYLDTDQKTGVAVSYQSRLFDTDQMIEIDIQMEENEWKDLLEHAIEEEYYCCDVVVNGETFSSVGIRAKGNTSLTTIANDPTTDRYSLKLEFDHYMEGQTCYDLDKLILNNNFADATNMKEAIVYDMFQYLDVDASLYNYAKVSVNGTYWGVYLALEGVEDSFMVRNYGARKGNLYKPESMGVGGAEEGPRGARAFGAAGEEGELRGENSVGEEGAEGGLSSGSAADNPFQTSETDGEEPGNIGSQPPGTDQAASENMGSQPPGTNQAEPGNIGSQPPDFENGGSLRNGFKGAMSRNSGGADLNYTDDDLDSYATIWDGEVTDSSKQDRRRVITALKNICGATELERYLDVDNILKYMAVHVFVVNLDSLSGTMAHNYYLYESNGQLNLLPWDYNLSFGGMSTEDASSMINDAIDTPFAGTQFFDALLEEEAYLARYHQYLQQLAEQYVFGGVFDQTYERIRNQIDSLVETDPTAFYSYEEYDVGAKMLCETVRLRAESILGQLNGSIPSTDAGQKEDPSALIEASSVHVETMGVFERGNNGLGQQIEGNNLGAWAEGSIPEPQTGENALRQPMENAMEAFADARMPQSREQSRQMAANAGAYAIYFGLICVVCLYAKCIRRRRSKCMFCKNTGRRLLVRTGMKK